MESFVCLEEANSIVLHPVLQMKGRSSMFLNREFSVNHVNRTQISTMCLGDFVKKLCH